MKSLSALALVLSIAGCNTFEGFGRDLAAGGEAIEEAATNARAPAPEPVYRTAPQPAPVYNQPLTPQGSTYSQPPPGSQYVY